MKTTAADAMLGLAYLASSLNVASVDFADSSGKVLSGSVDKELGIGLFARQHGRLPVDATEALADADVRINMHLVKSMIRHTLVESMLHAGDMGFNSRRGVKVTPVLPKTNVVHELGTVAEIATKYNMSKSEVRRHKAAGTLESHIAGLAQ